MNSQDIKNAISGALVVDKPVGSAMEQVCAEPVTRVRSTRVHLVY